MNDDLGEVFRVLGSKAYNILGDDIAERRIAMRDSHDIFTIPGEMNVKPGDLVYKPPEKEERMRTMTKAEEYMYYLGHATAIASVDVLLESLPREKLGDFVEEWAGLMKEGYAKTALWGDALNNLNKQLKEKKDGILS